MNLEREIAAETSRRVQLYPDVCGLRLYAQVILEMDPEKIRVEIEAHECRATPTCPLVLNRVLE